MKISVTLVLVTVLAIIAAVVSIAAIASEQGLGQSRYIAPGGNDRGGDCFTLSNPCATAQRVRDAGLYGDANGIWVF